MRVVMMKRWVVLGALALTSAVGARTPVSVVASQHLIGGSSRAQVEGTRSPSEIIQIAVSSKALSAIAATAERGFQSPVISMLPKNRQEELKKLVNVLSPVDLNRFLSMSLGDLIGQENQEKAKRSLGAAKGAKDIEAPISLGFRLAGNVRLAVGFNAMTPILHVREGSGGTAAGLTTRAEMEAYARSVSQRPIQSEEERDALYRRVLFVPVHGASGSPNEVFLMIANPHYREPVHGSLASFALTNIVTPQ